MNPLRVVRAIRYQTEEVALSLGHHSPAVYEKMDRVSDFLKARAFKIKRAGVNPAGDFMIEVERITELASADDLVMQLSKTIQAEESEAQGQATLFEVQK